MHSKRLAFQAKDALLVIDDFKPLSGNDRIHQSADRVLRGSANGSGRGRMRSNLSLRAPHPPRAMIVSTGEVAFRGESLTGRVFTVELDEGTLTGAN